MKRTARLISSLLFASILLNSCGGDSGTTDTTTDSGTDSTTPEVTTKEVLTDGLPDKDMDGFTFNILHHDSSWLTWAKTQLVNIEENEGELINDEIHKRNNYIEERFKCELNIEEIDKTYEVFRSLVQSGITEYDIVFLYGINVLGSIDYLSDFSKIPHLKLDEAHWNPAATDLFKVGDKQLAVAGNWSLSYLSGAMTYTFNKRVFDDLNTGKNLYQLVDDGKWTTDEFYEVAKESNLDLDADGNFGEVDDLYGVRAQAKVYYNTLFIGSGFRYVEFDKDHNPVLNLTGNEKVLNFLQKIVDTETANPSVYPVSQDMINASDPGGAVQASGGTGEYLFAPMAMLGAEGYLRNAKDDIGIVPPPKYDEAQEKYYTYANIGEIAVLPRTFELDRADNVGMLMEAMSFYSQQNIVPAYIETVLQSKAARDEDTGRMMDIIFNGIVFDYGTVIWESDITKSIVGNFLLPRSTQLVSTIESISTVVNGKITALIESAKNVP